MTDLLTGRLQQLAAASGQEQEMTRVRNVDLGQNRAGGAVRGLEMFIDFQSPAASRAQSWRLLQ
jgi:hypothetical protein